MADLQFIEEQDLQHRALASAQPSFLARIALSTGVVETEQGAQYLLLGVAVLCVIVTGYVLTTAFTRPAPPPNPFAIDLQTINEVNQYQQPYQP